MAKLRRFRFPPKGKTINGKRFFPKAHEDFSPPAPYQIFTAVWYGEYQGVVQAVPHRGIESTTPWYREYHAVVFQPIANIKNNTE